MTVHPDYRFVDLSRDDTQKIKAMERDLAGKYNREIVLIAYERPGHATDKSPIDDARRNTEGSERGPTFGYANAHGDHHPTLASVMGKDLAGGEDLRFGDVEPPADD